MIAGLFTLIACNAAVILGARRLVEEVRTGKPALDFVIFLLLRTLLISAVVLVAGLSHLLALVVSIVVALVAAGVATVLLAHGLGVPRRAHAHTRFYTWGRRGNASLQTTRLQRAGPTVGPVRPFDP